MVGDDGGSGDGAAVCSSVVYLLFTLQRPIRKLHRKAKKKSFLRLILV
jgi:hypothetical protein